MDNSNLKKAVAIAGGQRALARLISTPSRKVKQGHVWSWMYRSKRVPAEFVLPIEALTRISRHELRPDVFGPPPANKEEAA